MLNKTVLIGITGHSRTGKDTVADYLCEKYGFEKTAFADPLKKALKQLFGFSDDQLWGDEKNDIDERWNVSPRKVMQQFGGEFLLEGIYNYIPEIEEKVPKGMFKISVFENWYDKKLRFDAYLYDTVSSDDYKKKLYHCVVADMRYLREAEAIKRLGGTVWKVVRPKHQKKPSHMSETEVDQIKEDVLIVNDATIPELHKKIEKLMS